MKIKKRRKNKLNEKVKEGKECRYIGGVFGARFMRELWQDNRMESYHRQKNLSFLPNNRIY